VYKLFRLIGKKHKVLDRLFSLSRQYSSVKFLKYGLIGLFLAGITSLLVFTRNSPQYIDNPDESIVSSSDYFKVHQGDKENAAVFDVGLYLDSVYDLDLAELSFNARGWLWYTWIKTPLIEGKMDQKNILNFYFNLHDESSSSQDKTLGKPFYEDGEYWQQTSFDSKFSANKVDLRNFPFDRQKLQIIVLSEIFEAHELTFNPIQFRLPSKAFNITGYKLDGISIEDQVRVYSSNFYDASDVNWRDRAFHAAGSHPQSEASTQSQPTFTINISRNTLTSVIEYVLPLLIVSFLGVLVSFLGSELSEIKLSAPPAAILSLIFLQNSFMNSVPRTSYLTCLDLLFALAFLSCFCSFMNSFLERVDKNYSRYKPLLERSGIIVILASPLAVRAWLGLHG